jgi:hypothetical protein
MFVETRRVATEPLPGAFSWAAATVPQKASTSNTAGRNASVFERCKMARLFVGCPVRVMMGFLQMLVTLHAADGDSQ